MAFPQTVLPVKVRIAPGGQPAADPATWVWVDITQWVRVASGITIEVGRRDEGARVDPSKCTLVLDNRDGRFSTRNVLGPWYGQLAKGTPLRVGTIAIADAFGRTVSPGLSNTDTGQPWSPSSPSVWSVSPSTGGQVTFPAANSAFNATILNAELVDVDATITVSVPAVMTGASTVFATYLRYVDSSNAYWMSIEFNVGGTLTCKIRKTVAGVTTELATTGTIPSLTYTAGQKWKLRVQADGPALRVMIWAASGSAPTTWHCTASDTSLLGAGRFGLRIWCLSGNTNTMPMAVSFDDLEVEAVEFVGTVPEWPPRWDKSRKDATSPITASGILRRLQQGKTPLRSPITRMFLRNNPIALWPMEDESSSTVAAPGMPGVAAAAARAVEFAQTEPALAGAKQTAGITASTVMSGQIPAHTATGTWGVVWFAQLLAPPAAATTIMTVTTTGTIFRWSLDLESTGMRLRGYDRTNAVLYNQAVIYPTEVTPPTWIAFDLLVEQVGGNIQGTMITYGVHNESGTPTMYAFSGSVAGQVGSPTGWSMQGSLGFNGGRMGAVAVFDSAPPFVTYAFANAANGYIGETAAARVARLCAEENVQVVIEDGASESLGPQRTETFLNLLYSAEDADLGVLYERAAGLAYRPRGARYNRPVEFALDFTPGDVAEAPEPTDDDQQLKNQWTVSRDAGSTAVAADKASIDQFGLVEDSTTINVETDSVLPGHAAWRLATTTVDEYRWPSIVLNLARNTGQIRTWRAAQPFPRLTAANEPSQVTGNAVDVTALGYTMTIGPFAWDIDLNCAPSAPWSGIGIYDDTATRYDSRATTMNATAAAGATTLVLTFPTPSDAWSTKAAEQPFDLLIAGERVRVPVGGMGAVTGSGPYTQTITGAIRAVNLVSKALPAGAEVHVATPAYYAL